MAASSRVDRHLLPCLVLLVFLLCSSSQATEIKAGGRKSSWKIPSSPDAYTKWADKVRFLIGDYIVMEYDPNNDSVLEVNEADYTNCNRDNPIKAYHDRKTKIMLERSGEFYFISGADGHCEKGQKVAVRVLAAIHGTHLPNATAPTPTPAPAPAPSDSAPAPAPEADGGHVLKMEAFVCGISVVFGTLASLALL